MDDADECFTVSRNFAKLFRAPCFVFAKMAASRGANTPKFCGFSVLLTASVMTPAKSRT